MNIMNIKILRFMFENRHQKVLERSQDEILFV